MQDEHSVEGKGKGANKVNLGGIVVDGSVPPSRSSLDRRIVLTTSHDLSSCIIRKLTLVTSQLHAAGAKGTTTSTVSKVTHNNPAKDEFTGYNAPASVKFEWSGPVEGVSHSSSATDPSRRGLAQTDATSIHFRVFQGEGTASAYLDTVTGAGEVGVGNLIEKVDVLAEIPYVYVCSSSQLIFLCPPPVSCLAWIGYLTSICPYFLCLGLS